MIFTVLHRALIVIVIVALTLLLARQSGAWVALGSIAVIAAFVCGLGAALLKTTTVGKITWKNRVAGYLLPWGYKLGGGQLPGIALVVWLSWLLIAGITLASTRYAPSSATVGWGRATAVWLTWACWLILAGAAALLLFRFAQFSREGSKPSSSIAKAMAGCIALLLGSIAASAFHYPVLALLIAGVPIVLTLLPVTVMLLMMLGYSLAGKPVRWN